MSGGFFRGTSADQDTRFSNKQAKLMKSQKFAPELDHLVDITKVQMDVVKPWIATKVTELLGFEDEVLINFIYGLLDGKVINGKAVQIQITGFMEKNTGKFMKELWGLLLSAQSNTSGVPQKFLDDKEEEIRKKKVESDRITHEIQKKKESEQEKAREMDGVVDVSRDVDGAAKHNAKHFSPRDPGLQADEEKEYDERNGFRGKSRISRSPHAAKRSPSAERMRRSRSISKSPSNSRSHSGPESASMSRSPHSRGNSISPRRRYPSPRKRSMSPRNMLSPRRPRSPIRRRSPRLRRRSSSDSWVRSPSPRRRRSPTPVRRRPSPRRRRSPSPVQRRSPSARRRRSPSPFRRRSPFPRRRRSPSPVRRRSPHMRRRSPLHRRSPSPMRRRSPAPIRRRSPSPLRRRSPTPLRRRSPFSPHRRYPSPSRRRSTTPPRRRSPSPVTRRSPPPRSPRQRRRSPLRSPIQRSRSPYRSHSPAYRGRRSLSRDHDIVSNGVGAKGYGERTLDEMSPVHEVPEREEVSPSGQGRRGLDSMVRRPPISLRSPQHEPRDRSDARPEVPLSLEEKSPSRSDSSPLARKSSPSEDRSPIRKTRDRVAPVDSPSPNRETRNRVTRRYSPEKDVPRYPRGYGGQRNDSPLRRIRDSPKAVSHRNVPVKEPHHGQYPFVAERRSSEAPRRGDHKNIIRNDRDKRSQKAFMKTERPVSPRQSPQREESEFGHGRTGGTKFSPDYISDEHPSAKRSKSPSGRKTQKAYPDEHYGVDEKKRSRSHNAVNSGVIEDSAQMPMRKGDFNKRTLHIEADFMENEKNQPGDIETRKHKRLERREVASDDSESDNSLIDERKEAKRRKKEEKRMRKEERRRRRHERHRRREERRASKHKAKSMDTVTPPSDIERHHSDDDNSDVASKRDSRPSDTEGTESMQKKLEIELRKKALESLRAKKAINS